MYEQVYICCTLQIISTISWRLKIFAGTTWKITRELICIEKWKTKQNRRVSLINNPTAFFALACPVEKAAKVRRASVHLPNNDCTDILATLGTFLIVKEILVLRGTLSPTRSVFEPKLVTLKIRSFSVSASVSCIPCRYLLYKSSLIIIKLRGSKKTDPA